MAETLTTIITAVRDALLNITTSEIADAVIDEQIRQALARIQRDYPRAVFTKFAGTGVQYYKLSTVLTSWTADFSYIKTIIAPAPTVADDDDIEYLAPAEWDIYNDGTDEYLRFAEKLGSDEYAVIEYTTPWILNGLDAATSTTLTTAAVEALKYLASAYVCYSLSAKASGTMDSQMPGDFINYRSKQSEYKRAGDTFLTLYNDVITTPGPIKAAFARADYETRLQHGGAKLTHPYRIL